MSAAAPRRWTLALVLLLAVLGVGVLMLRGHPEYAIHARFLDAGLLVPGGRVEVAGRKVGKISDISLTPQGQADVTLSLGDSSIIPLHQGTRAAIRAVGQVGVANRFVDLTPGPSSAPTLPDGAALGTDQTTGIVNIDAIFDSFGPAQRESMRQFFANNAGIYAGSGARYFNRMLAELEPATLHFQQFWGDLARDRVGIRNLVHTAAVAGTAVASRRQDLTAAVREMGVSFAAIAHERGQLDDLLARAPAVLRQATGTLGRTSQVVTALRPALRDIPPVTGPLRGYLHATAAVLPPAVPVLSRVRALLPSLAASLRGLQPLQRPAVQALQTTGQAMQAARHILQPLRIYGTDLVLGVLSGLAGISNAEYDALGHYQKANFVQSAQTLLSGRLAPLLSGGDLVPGLLGTRTHLTRRCPGGNVPPSPDGSSPWIVPSLCNPADDTPASVNEP